jgi:hypothetical protein
MAEIPSELLAQIRELVAQMDLPADAELTLTGPMGEVAVGQVADLYHWHRWW